MMSPISASRSQKHRAGRGFTLLEVLTTLAFLVVVMGLMVSLARYVRAQSAQQYTRHLLAELDQAQRLYATDLGVPAGDVEAMAAVFSASADEPAADEYVRNVNGPYVAAMLSRLHPTERQTAVRDAWGNPIGYLPSQNPRIGMAPQNQPFFFSAGPDGRFLTRQDNLYSYEQIKPGDLPDLPTPMQSGSAPGESIPAAPVPPSLKPASSIPAASPGIPLDTAKNKPTTAPSHQAMPDATMK